MSIITLIIIDVLRVCSEISSQRYVAVSAQNLKLFQS
jgi:hypothetical protein